MRKNLRFVLLFATLLLSVAPVSAQSGRRKVTDPPEILRIRAQFKAINAKKSYTIRKRYEGVCDANSHTTGYCNRGTLVKAVIRYGGGEGADTVRELYYDNGNLIFAYDRTPGRARRVSEDRLYFVQGRLIRWLGDKNAPQRTDTANAAQSAQSVLDESRAITARLNAPGY